MYVFLTDFSGINIIQFEHSAKSIKKKLSDISLNLSSKKEHCLRIQGVSLFFNKYVMVKSRQHGQELEINRLKMKF